MHDGLLWVFLLNRNFRRKFISRTFYQFFSRILRYDALVRADSGIMDAKTITDLIMHLWPST